MRTERTPEELDKVAEELMDVGRVLQSVAQEMRSHGVESISTHGKTPVDRHIPMLLNWIYKVEAESKVQIRAANKSKDSRNGASRNGHAKRTLPRNKEDVRNSTGGGGGDVTTLNSKLTALGT